MTNTELIHQIYQQSGLKKMDVIKVIELQRLAFETVLARGGSVSVSGLGVFAVTRKAARIGRNPRTGDAIRISAKKFTKFSVAPTLAKKING